MDGRTIIKRVLIGLGVAIVVGYSYFALEGYVRGPRIVLTAPQSGFATTTAWVTVVGRTIHTSTLTLNGATTSPDLAGNFSESLLLAPGYNIMRVAAVDRYGRMVEKTIEMTLVTPSTDSGQGTATTTATGSTSSPQMGSGIATSTPVVDSP